MKFLTGLHSYYDHVKDQILLMKPMPSLNKVYSMLSHMEKQNEVSSARTLEIASYTTTNSSNLASSIVTAAHTRP